jgi:hypothetical protein
MVTTTITLKIQTPDQLTETAMWTLAGGCLREALIKWGYEQMSHPVKVYEVEIRSGTSNFTWAFSSTNPAKTLE